MSEKIIKQIKEIAENVCRNCSEGLITTECQDCPWHEVLFDIELNYLLPKPGTDSKDLDLIVWFDNLTGEKILEFNQDEFLKKAQKLAQNYGFDFNWAGTPIQALKHFKRLEEVGYFNDEEK